MTTRNWNRTEREKANMAKLAVLISSPRKYITHWSFSTARVPRGNSEVEWLVESGSELEPQGVVRSDSKTPFSRANCSRVIGMKEPIHRDELVFLLR
jgi:hypothetical protein